jgi:hypothetical protein
MVHITFIHESFSSMHRMLIPREIISWSLHVELTSIPDITASYLAFTRKACGHTCPKALTHSWLRAHAQIIEQCWHPLPNKRPSFAELKLTFKDLAKSIPPDVPKMPPQQIAAPRNIHAQVPGLTCHVHFAHGARFDPLDCCCSVRYKQHVCMFVSKYSNDGCFAP